MHLYGCHLAWPGCPELPRTALSRRPPAEARLRAGCGLFMHVHTRSFPVLRVAADPPAEARLRAGYDRLRPGDHPLRIPTRKGPGVKNSSRCCVLGTTPLTYASSHSVCALNLFVVVLGALVVLCATSAPVPHYKALHAWVPAICRGKPWHATNDGTEHVTR